MAEANAINAATAGIVGNTGTSFTGSPATQYNVQVGGATTSALVNVAPSATSGIPLVSAGSSANPSFTTAVVAGGGTGNTTFTAYSVITAGTTATGAFQNVSGVGTSGQVLTSAGASALPTWSNGGMVLIQTQTTAGAASLDFTTGIGSPYSKYLLIGTNVKQVATAAYIYLRVSTDGGGSYIATGYTSGIVTFAYNGTTATNANVTTSFILHAITSGGPGVFQSTLDLTAGSQPGATTHGSHQNTLGNSVSSYTTNSTVNAIRVLADAGTMSGTFSLYGLVQ